MSILLNLFSEFPLIELRHVCTNCLVSEEIATDYKTNLFMQRYLRPHDKLIVNHPILIKHIQKNYPKTELIYSTTMNITDINIINELTKDHIYVLNYNYNNNNEYLKQLKYPNNIEILCAEQCMPNCPQRMNHYEYVSKTILGLEEGNQFHCNSGNELLLFDDIMKLPTAITSQRIDELAAMGIQYFKISGRTSKTPNWLISILYYLALPEYRDHIYLKLLNKWW